MINEYIMGIKQLADMAIKTEENDYYDEEGFLCCGECHTRKEKDVVLLGKTTRVKMICKCASEKREELERIEKEKLHAEEIEKIRKDSFPSRSFCECDFAHANDTNGKLIQALKRYVDNFDKFLESGKGLMLYGTVGTGKTYLAACVANALIDKDVPVLFTSMSRICNTIMGLYKEKQEYIDSLSRYKLLVIDDFAAERNTEYMNEIVYTVIDGRYKEKLPMIITTNLTSEQLKNPPDIASERTYSRILEMCHPVKVEGIDIRRTKAKDEFKAMAGILGI